MAELAQGAPALEGLAPRLPELAEAPPVLVEQRRVELALPVLAPEAAGAVLPWPQPDLRRSFSRSRTCLSRQLLPLELIPRGAARQALDVISCDAASDPLAADKSRLVFEHQSQVV